ncbi:MAG TPA: bifunctional DNA-formamidopyrimidine glycosylase/DNA-(apurinic or apyrimidinic site) lyase [Mycobacteriales bacterium]|nr:bifunctional DNA-formamidopyrimidine glycosylase/DNA-(apurinic or apyrimidinic site) lyase [Mycobacteriales bacterium]
MPELPEVEVVRRGLASWVVGRTVAETTVTHPRAVRRHLAGADDFAAVLTGRTITGTRRRGKYLWLPLDSGDAVLAHLGMSGQLLVQPPEAPDEIHLRIRIRFSTGDGELRFVDQRTFGGLSYEIDGAELPKVIAHIARDPLDPEFDDDAFFTAVRRRKTALKRALLDQSLISGVGNIYADEALWAARLHGARPTETMRRPELQRLLAAVRAVMAAALSEGGTSFDALYVNVNGESGYFDRSLNAYGRAGKACRRCGSAIRRDAFMNRSSFTCPQCQRLPRRRRT